MQKKLSKTLVGVILTIFLKGAYINLDEIRRVFKSLYSGMTRLVIDLELATRVFAATVLVDRYSLIKQSPILP